MRINRRPVAVVLSVSRDVVQSIVISILTMYSGTVMCARCVEHFLRVLVQERDMCLLSFLRGWLLLQRHRGLLVCCF
jgi:hypothetical protein